jgi:hypothetical protein
MARSYGGMKCYGTGGLDAAKDNDWWGKASLFEEFVKSLFSPRSSQRSQKKYF